MADLAILITVKHPPCSKKHERETTKRQGNNQLIRYGIAALEYIIIYYFYCFNYFNYFYYLYSYIILMILMILINYLCISHAHSLIYQSHVFSHPAICKHSIIYEDVQSE